ncbi:type II toxin-antitoxin system HicB family antitoxin [Undibacterium sp. TC9W]|uniref:type II toxin-antitoxin system HicB family antitoxin n=1 Tax=Undibacterium sp. TC9W TaxID=3413053 RepID=UPI003BF08D73
MDIAIVIHKDEGSEYGVTVPDIPGCFSSGDTVDEAIESTKAAIYSHVSYLIESGEQLDIKVSKIEDLRANPDYNDGIWALVNIDMAKLDSKPERINISVPRFVLTKIDEYIGTRHETRSGFLARAALNAISEDLNDSRRNSVVSA